MFMWRPKVSGNFQICISVHLKDIFFDEILFVATSQSDHLKKLRTCSITIFKDIWKTQLRLKMKNIVGSRLYFALNL